MICPICLHDYHKENIMDHHLIPKCRKGSETAPICEYCHAQIHANFSEKEIGLYFYTIELLLASPRLQGYIKWIRKRKPNGKLKTKDRKSRKSKRRR